MKISVETAQNEMHGGQAIPAFDFYLAPFVRSSYIEEVKQVEAFDGNDYSELYDMPVEDYLKRPLDGLVGVERVKQHAVNKTVGKTRVRHPIVATSYLYRSGSLTSHFS